MSTTPIARALLLVALLPGCTTDEVARADVEGDAAPGRWSIGVDVDTVPFVLNGYAWGIAGRVEPLPDLRFGVVFAGRSGALPHREPALR